jgi:Mn2+/Fe2+ NRAMP family transporter
MFIALLVQNPPPYVGELFLGFLPSAKLIENDNLFVLVSILGATCMPHS